jgi:hypothetical protein
VGNTKTKWQNFQQSSDTDKDSSSSSGRVRSNSIKRIAEKFYSVALPKVIGSRSNEKLQAPVTGKVPGSCQA